MSFKCIKILLLILWKIRCCILLLTFSSILSQVHSYVVCTVIESLNSHDYTCSIKNRKHSGIITRKLIQVLIASTLEHSCSNTYYKEWIEFLIVKESSSFLMDAMLICFVCTSGLQNGGQELLGRIEILPGNQSHAAFMTLPGSRMATLSW